ncbi:MAG: anthranilate synthase component I [Thermomicrobiales bacterium]|nr:anthranilate synthase component I [Thermomicrobiales bacterium]
MVQSTVAPMPRMQTRGSVTPSLDEIEAWLARQPKRPRFVPIYREVMADTETPVSAFHKIKRDAPAFLLESVEGGQRVARYSFIGSEPFLDIVLDEDEATIVSSDAIRTERYSDPLTLLSSILTRYDSGRMDGLPLPRFLGGAVGFLSYEAIRAFEPRVPAADGPGRGFPIGRFMIVNGLLVFDNLERTVKVVSHLDLSDNTSIGRRICGGGDADRRVIGRLRSTGSLPAGDDPVNTPLDQRMESNTSIERYHEFIESAREYIRAGDIFQVVLSQRVDVETPAHPFTIYRALRAVNPSPYMFYLDFNDYQIVGASPELLVRLEDGVVTNHPIAGTRPRGATPEADAALAEELINDEKERAEHVMLVDLGRNDIGRVAKPGTVRVPRFMEIDRYSHVMHIVTHVEGDIRPDMSAFDALRACFPAGTVSGAPKVRAMEIIAEQEVDRRGPYSGAVGYIDFAGDMDTCIALRTLVYKDGIASMQAGGGIVADSTPEGEYAESYHKMGALIRAIELAERIESDERSFAVSSQEGRS